MLILAIPSAAEARRDGLYLRGQVGLGGARAGTDVAGIDIQYSGGAGALNLELGGSLGTRWALFGRFYGMTIPNLDYDVEGFTGPTETGGFIRGLGIGIRHFFPSNFSLGGALTFSTIGTAEDGEQFYDSDPGPMLHFTLGYDWWVGRETAVGVGGEFAFGGFPDNEIDDEGFVWGGSFGVVYFSVTYN